MTTIRRPLFLKLIIPMVIIIPVITLVSAYFFVDNSTRVINRQANDEALDRGRAITRHFSDVSNDFTLFCQLIASNRELVAAVKDNDELKIAQALLPLALHIPELQIDVFNGSGVPVKSFSNARVAKPPVIGDGGLYTADSESGMVYLSDTERQYGVIFPIRDANAGIVGAVMVSESLDKMLEPLEQAIQASISIRNDKGREIFATDSKIFARVSAPDLSEIPVSSSPVRFGPQSGEYRYFAKPVLVGGKNILVSFSTSYADENIETRETLTQILVYAAILMLVLLVGSWVGARIFLSPLEKLVAVTEEIAGGDLTARADIKTNDEIEELSTVFNWMADRLQLRITQAEEMAIIDSLTGLYNHRYFYEQLDKEIERAERFNGMLSVLFIDIDDFKIFNDQNGHTYGDAALKEIARLIQISTRSIDTPARYGGEEFTVILPAASSDDAIDVAERLRATVDSFRFKSRHNIEFSLTISVGIATYPSDAENSEDLISRADLAMYQSKSDGKNLVRVFSEAESGGSIADREFEREIENVREKMLVKAVLSLAVAVDARDRYTRSHSEFVAKYAAAISRRLPVSERFVKDLSIAGLLHDAGKIGVPDSILNKDEQLDGIEWEAIRRHPSLGAEIARNIGPDATVLKSILYHHENYDGTGYPDSLNGEDIPLGARIIAVVDAYHAMITDRPYRKAMTPDAAVNELKKKSGTQFDPEIVEVFLDVLDEEAQATPTSHDPEVLEPDARD